MFDLLNAATQILFLALFAWSVWRAIRDRSRIALDVALVFGPLAIVLLASWAQPMLGAAAPVAGQITSGLLFAQPIFVLRLVADIRPVSRWLLPLAVGAFAVTALPVVVFGASVPGQLGLAALGVFVVTELVGALYLGLEAAHRYGSARIRMAVAALATGAVSSVLLIATLDAVITEIDASGIVRVISLIAAIAYWIAFLPPRRLRRYWQATTAYDHAERLLSNPATVRAVVLWETFAASVAQLTSSTAVVLILDRLGSLNAVASTDPAVRLETAHGQSDLEAMTTGLGGDPVSASLLRQTGGRVAQVVPLLADGRTLGAVVLLRPHPSLFDADDAALVASLGLRSAYLVDRREALAEQERLTARLEETVEALRLASAAKSDFLASMSHELRTPLNAIIGFSELMAAEPERSGAVNIPVEWVEHIRSGGAHLLALINDILDLAKVEAGRLELDLKPIDLAMAVAESVAGLRPLAERKDHRVTVSAEVVTVEADPGRVRQILYNLLSNAIKYTPDGGSIDVTVARSGDDVRMSVQDTGVGIAEADLAYVFEQFRQVGDHARKEGGTGLGLALTQRLVEAHGGRLEVASQPGVGSVFTVVLPSVLREKGRPQPSTADIRPRGGVDVLIIEDEPSSVRLLQTYLADEGHGVRVASDGETGIALALASPPAAIVLDVLLPGIDGWEVLRRLKADERLRDIPVIIVTVVDERTVGLALGAVDYLLKPIERDALLDRLRRHTRSSPIPSEGFNILAIDDDIVSLDLIEQSLVPLGFSVDRAASGRDGLASAARSRPDLVICDLLMPEMDGFEVIERLHSDPLTEGVPILVLTSHTLTEREKLRLNGRILGLVEKGQSASSGLRDWLHAVLPQPAEPSAR